MVIRSNTGLCTSLEASVCFSLSTLKHTVEAGCLRTLSISNCIARLSWRPSERIEVVGRLRKLYPLDWRVRLRTLIVGAMAMVRRGGGGIVRARKKESRVGGGVTLYIDLEVAARGQVCQMHVLSLARDKLAMSPSISYAFS